ncbi:hypothetical protein AX16_004595 [Volvariella volvacea WC 439]|nr:hypothetical protein AX16_004595 [Volvariella volvacea WC 439]
MPPSHLHHHHPHHTEYAPPVIHPPSSPTSSLSSTFSYTHHHHYLGHNHDPDRTCDSECDSDTELSQFQFEKKCEERLGLTRPKLEEELAMSIMNPLLPKVTDEEERQDLFEAIMKNLRSQIEQIEENELFEQRLLQGSQIGLEPLPSTHDIDAILKSMMGPSTTSTTTTTGSNSRNSSSQPPDPTAAASTAMVVDNSMTGIIPTGIATNHTGIQGLTSKPTIAPGPWNMPREEVKQFSKFVNGQRKNGMKPTGGSISALGGGRMG